MQRLAVLAIVLAATAPARAETELHRQLEADLGLSVIQLAYEVPLAGHVAASLSAGVFGSYFLPWFDRGDDVIGVGGGVRVTGAMTATSSTPFVALDLLVGYRL